VTHLDLFTGIGGFTIASGWCGYQPVQFVENNSYCQAVLKKHWPEVPLHDDIRTFQWTGEVDLITAGVPCQPVSVAGDMRGTDDERWLWDEAIRVISEASPSYALMENPTGLLHVHGGRAWAGILSDLHSIGYDLWWETVGSYSVGAPHTRNRVWLVAANTKRGQRGEEPHGGEARRVGRERQPVAWDERWQDALRRLRGVDDGSGYTSQRVDTIRNSITPQVAYHFLKTLNTNTQ